MKYSTPVRVISVAMAAAMVLAPAYAAVKVGQILLFFEPVALQANPDFRGADRPDGEVIFMPHDGSFETGFSIPTQEDVEFVQFWAFPSSEGTLTGFEACFYSFTAVVDFEFQFMYYGVNAGGEDAEPGGLKEDRDSQIFDIPAGEITCPTINFLEQGGSADPGVEIRDPLTYLGVRWNGEEYPTVKILVDTNHSETTNGWGRVTDFGSDWIPLRLTEPFTAYRNLGIRFGWLGPTIGPDDIFEDDFESGDTSKWADQEPNP
jgi:hypothetical protein